jgi:hypothetical protein
MITSTTTKITIVNKTDLYLIFFKKPEKNIKKVNGNKTPNMG